MYYIKNAALALELKQHFMMNGANSLLLN